MSIGSVVHVRGTVTGAAGVILDGSTIAIQDSSAGIYVRLPEASMSGLGVGTLVDVIGGIAAPYGNLELRPTVDGISVTGSASLPAPMALSLAQLNDSTEGLLASVNVTVASLTASSSGSLTLGVADASGDGRVYFFEPLGYAKGDFAVGRRESVRGRPS
jgi:hypothetical protein